MLLNIVPFSFKYLKLLKELHDTREVSYTEDLTMSALPKIGYIALLNTQPIAAGFLRRVEGGYGQIDCLVSNRYFGSQLRHEGLNLVLDSLLADAKRLKMHGIISFTKDDGTLKRAESLGFTVLEHKTIVLKMP